MVCETVLGLKRFGTGLRKSRSETKVIPMIKTMETISSTTEPAATTPTVSTLPTTTVPESALPQKTVSETTGPQTTVSETTGPQTTVSETTGPQTTVPQTTLPQSTEPQSTVTGVTSTAMTPTTTINQTTTTTVATSTSASISSEAVTPPTSTTSSSITTTAAITGSTAAITESTTSQSPSTTPSTTTPSMGTPTTSTTTTPATTSTTTSPTTASSTTTPTTTATTATPSTSSTTSVSCDYSQFGATHTMLLPAKAGCNPHLTGVTDAEKATILAAHNNLRAKVARGEETRGAPGPQPAGANIREIVWNDELAKVAQAWAAQCPSGHDTNNDRKICSRGYSVGQNLYSAWGFDASSAWQAAVQAWYDEVANMPNTAVSSIPGTSANGQVIGHYTQVVWAKTNEVGCGAISYSSTSGGTTYPESKIYVCNYGEAGNFRDQPVYATGPAASQCTGAASTAYTGLCS